MGRDQAGELRAGELRAAGRPVGGRRDAGRRAAGFGGEAGRLRNLVVHSAIVGLAGVLVPGALLLAAVAGIVTGTAQPSSSAPPAVSAQR